MHLRFSCARTKGETNRGQILVLELGETWGETWGQTERFPGFRESPVPQVRVRSVDANLGQGVQMGDPNILRISTRLPYHAHL
jgi:hypothetical protein